ARMVEVLKQGQYQPLPVEKQILIIYAGTAGYLDAVPVSEVQRYERELYAFVEGRRPEVLRTIAEKSKSGDAYKDLVQVMNKALDEFKQEFSATPAPMINVKAKAS